MKQKSHNQKLPTLTETISTPDAIGFFEGVALAGMEGVRMRVSHSVQRKHFGKIVFGKKAVTIKNATILLEYNAGYTSTCWESVDSVYSATHNAVGTFSEGELFRTGAF